MDSSQIRLINLIEKLSLYPQIVIRDNPEIFDTYKISNIHNHGRYNFFVSNLLQINDCLTKINTNSGTVSFDKVGENQLASALAYQSIFGTDGRPEIQFCSSAGTDKNSFAVLLGRRNFFRNYISLS